MFGQGLLKGLAITWKELFTRKVTVQYPEEKVPLPARFHGRFELDVDKCIACGLCVNACPNQVIQMTKQKVGKKQFLTKYVMRIEYCLFCGMCVEACNKDALAFSQVFDMNQYFRDKVRLVLVDRPAPEVLPEETPEESTAGRPAAAQSAKSKVAAAKESGKEG